MRSLRASSACRSWRAFAAARTPTALIAQLDLIASRLPEKYGGSPAYAEIIARFVPRVVPLEEELLGPLARPLWILLGAMAVLLVIACANVANLFLARTERQRRDIAVRHAIGAGRGHLIRRQLAETFVVAIAAGVLAVGIAAALVPLIVEQAPVSVPRLSGTELSLTTVLFTFAVSIVAGLACGSRSGAANGRRQPRRGCAKALAARPTAGAGRATASSWRKRRSRCCCSSAPASCYAAWWSSATSTLATSRRTSSRFSSRKSRSNGATDARRRAFTSTSWSDCGACPASKPSASWKTFR